MLIYKFQYPVKPIDRYNIRYGLKPKARPYHFKYPVGIENGGSYRFNYDRRYQIYIEDGDIGYILFPKDMDINIEPEPFVKRLHEIAINKEFDLKKPLTKKVAEENMAKELKASVYKINKESFLALNEPVYKDLEIEKQITLVKTIEKILDIYQNYLFERNIFKILFIENSEYILKERLKKDLNIEMSPKSFSKPISELMIDKNGIALNNVKKALEKEIERLFFREIRFGLEKDTFLAKLETTFIELISELEEELLKLNLEKSLGIFKELNLTKYLIKDMEIEKMYEILSKEGKVVALIKSAVILSKLENEITSHEEKGPYFKVLNEIFKHEEVFSNILFLYAIYDMFQEKDFAQIEIKEKDIDKFKDKVLDKNFEVDLEIEDIFKMLANITKYDLFEDVKGNLLKGETIHEAEMEESLKQIKEVYEFIVDIEKSMNQLDKEFITDLYEEKDIHQLAKKLVLHGIITEDEGKVLEKSSVGQLLQVLLEMATELDKIIQVRDIEIEESFPVVKGFKEIMINEDVEAAKAAIEIDINKEKEFYRVLREIELESDDEKIEFYKRFWFLRATDPFDLKILPYNDYPYREKPVVFGKKLIPDNWQLDMPWVPRLHEGIYEHPIPYGEGLGRKEMELSIEIMIDIINIMILIWIRMFYNFSGYTGSQAVIRFTKILYDWLMLETSIEEMEKKGSKEHYFRCYNWIRWEAEKVAIKARDDMSLSGNMYISEWIFELIYYMENHHFDTMPIFDIIEKMDEIRALLPEDDPQGDINFVLDKLKGMRHKIIECKTKKSNE